MGLTSLRCLLCLQIVSSSAKVYVLCGTCHSELMHTLITSLYLSLFSKDPISNIISHWDISGMLQFKHTDRAVTQWESVFCGNVGTRVKICKAHEKPCVSNPSAVETSPQTRWKAKASVRGCPLTSMFTLWHARETGWSTRANRHLGKDSSSTRKCGDTVQSLNKSPEVIFIF